MVAGHRQAKDKSLDKHPSPGRIPQACRAADAASVAVAGPHEGQIENKKEVRMRKILALAMVAGLLMVAACDTADTTNPVVTIVFPANGATVVQAR